jgi:hypothetical protein
MFPEAAAVAKAPRQVSRVNLWRLSVVVSTVSHQHISRWVWFGTGLCISALLVVQHTCTPANQGWAGVLLD